MIDNVLVLIVAPAVTALITYLVTRRKYNAEAKDVELDNVAEAIKIWRETAESLAQEYRDKLTEKDSIIEELRDLMLQYKQNHQKVLKKLTALEKDYNALSKKYNELIND